MGYAVPTNANGTFIRSACEAFDFSSKANLEDLGIGAFPRQLTPTKSAGRSLELKSQKSGWQPWIKLKWSEPRRFLFPSTALVFIFCITLQHREDYIASHPAPKRSDMPSARPHTENRSGVNYVLAARTTKERSFQSDIGYGLSLISTPMGCS